MNATFSITPPTLSPINNFTWWGLSSEWVNVTNFKFVFNVKQIEANTTTIQEDLGEYLIPTNPDGYGRFSPHSILRSKLNPTLMDDLIGFQQMTDDFVKYTMVPGIDVDLEIPYYDEFYNGGFISLTFSMPHNLINGMYIELRTESTVNPDYDGLQGLITGVLNDYAVETDMPWGNSGPAIGGQVLIPYEDVFNSSGYLGLSFSGTQFFKTGDIITIDKLDKSVNLSYDGAWTVTSSNQGAGTLITDAPYGTAMDAGVDGGYISHFKRYNSPSGHRWAYNGTRQYTETESGLDLQFRVAAATMTSTGGASAAGFLTEFTDFKKVPDYEYETIAAFCTSDVEVYELMTWDENMTLLGIQYISPDTLNGVYLFGCGPENIRGMFGTSSLNGAKYYQLRFGDTPVG